MRIDMLQPNAAQVGNVDFGEIFLSGGAPYMRLVPVDEPANHVVWAACLRTGEIRKFNCGNAIILANQDQCAVVIR